MAEGDLFGSFNKMEEEGVKYGRRRFIIALGVGVLGYGGWKYYGSLPQKYIPRKTSFITPNHEFYKMSVNMFYAPEIDIKKWRLQLIGLDGKSLAVSMDDIKALPNKTIHYTFSCISNPVGGSAISNAEWRVTPLKEFLKPVLPNKSDGIRMKATGTDTFWSSVPLDLALDDDSYLAYEMNGVPIPLDHGYPARIIVPGRYGMKQPKWLKKIEITDRKITGYWEEQAWSDDAFLNAMTRLDRAENIEAKGQDVVLMGIAFTGRLAVGQVEVSVDGGSSWNQAEFETKPQKNVWTLWKYYWKRPEPGKYTVVCRVIDESGKRQIESYADTFPTGSTGLHKVNLTIV